MRGLVSVALAEVKKRGVKRGNPRCLEALSIATQEQWRVEEIIVGRHARRITRLERGTAQRAWTPEPDRRTVPRFDRPRRAFCDCPHPSNLAAVRGCFEACCPAHCRIAARTHPHDTIRPTVSLCGAPQWCSRIADTGPNGKAPLSPSTSIRVDSNTYPAAGSARCRITAFLTAFQVTSVILLPAQPAVPGRVAF